MADRQTVDDIGFMKDVLDIFHKADIHESLTWYLDAGKIYFGANCSDLFYWGTADVEPIESEADVELLRKCYNDLSDAKKQFSLGISPSFLTPELYASRRRGMRPMKLWYKAILSNWGESLYQLFDACGPDRGDES